MKWIKKKRWVKPKIFIFVYYACIYFLSDSGRFISGLSMGFDITSWYKKQNDGDVVVSFKGAITTDLITDVLDVIEAKLGNSDINPKTIKKVYNVLVECLQNLYHHAEKININGFLEKDKDLTVFVVLRKDDKFRITTGNVIKTENIGFLKNKMNHLNSLNEDELKSLYKEILNNQDFSEKGGGGLGMIDMVRKSGGKIEYNFYELHKDYSFFDFSINIS